MSEKSIILTSPGIENSLGHDKYSMIINNALVEEGFKILPMKLKPDVDNNQLESLAWGMVETGKNSFSEHARNPRKKNIFQGLAGKVIDNLSGLVRTSLQFQELLTQSYRSQLSNFPDIPIISSHYMSFVPNHPGIFLTPDIYLHEASYNMLTRCNSVELVVPQQPTLNSIHTRGNNLAERVISTQLPISRSLMQAVDQRISRQESITKKEINTHNILVTIGASGPEIPEVLDTIQKILENPTDKFGRDYKIHVLCGDQTKLYNKQFAEELNCLKLRYDCQFDFDIASNRDEELAQWYSAIGNPQYDTLITRPNEMLTIAPALGFRTILLKPFQKHEEYSTRAGIIQKKCESNIYPIRWLMDEQGKFAGFHRDCIAHNYQNPYFWCRV
jgi:hypothetical protein